MHAAPTTPTLFPYTTLFRSARDVIVVIGALVLHLLTGTVTVKPSWTGKCATALQMVALSFVLLQLNLFSTQLRVGSWTVPVEDRKSTRLNSSHLGISYAVFC